jgi:hypothetical protein
MWAPTVGRRGARLSERQPAAPLPSLRNSVQGCRPAHSSSAPSSDDAGSSRATLYSPPHQPDYRERSHQRFSKQPTDRVTLFRQTWRSRAGRPARGLASRNEPLLRKDFQEIEPHTPLQKAVKGSLLLLDFVVLGQSQRASRSAATIPRSAQSVLRQ